jgi:hypothetical protein
MNMDSFDNLEVLNEYALIVRNQHPAWRGDRVWNGEHFAWMVGRDFSGAAELLCIDITNNLADYSELTGLPDRSLLIFCQNCRRGIKAAA